MGWVNRTLGIGTTATALDETGYTAIRKFTRELVEALWRQNGIARKIVWLMPFDATREGWDRYAAWPEDCDRALAAEEIRLGLKQEIRKALVWERLYGGAGIVVDVDDGGQPWEPLRPEQVRRVRSITTRHRWELWPHAYINAPGSPDDGLPEIYNEMPDNGLGTSGRLIHRSRIVILDGGITPGRSRFENDGWGVSVLESIWEELRNAGISDRGVIDYLLQLSIPAIRLKELAKLRAGKGNATKLEAMLLELRQRMSMFRLMVLDSEDEVERLNAQVGGLSDILNHQKGQVCAVANYPRMLLYGDSPSGLNATGAGELETYYGWVRADGQASRIQPCLDALYPLIVGAPVWGPGGRITNPIPQERRADPPDIEFRPLWVPSEKERADTALVRAQQITTYVGMGLITDSEARRLLAQEGLLQPEDIEGDDEPEPEGLAGGEGGNPMLTMGAITDEEEDEAPEPEQPEGGAGRTDAADVEPWMGRKVRIEYRRGDVRAFDDPRWPPMAMPCAYGEVIGSTGLDGEPVDVLFWPSFERGETCHAGIILHPESGALDEVKLVAGAPDSESAQALIVMVYGSLHAGPVVEVDAANLPALLGEAPRKDAEVPEDLRTPTEAMARNAERALKVRAEKPPSQRGMTAVGLARARDIANRRPLSVETWKRIASYISRHEVDKQGSTWSEQGKGWQAWNGWGGDEAGPRARAVLRAAEEG